MMRSMPYSVDRFQPTLPARGATAPQALPVAGAGISTHAPRTGSDALPCLAARVYSNFNPRSPHGERHCTAPGHPAEGTFQPTLPARGATRFQIKPGNPAENFNPRSPHGERHRHKPDGRPPRHISTHAPRTGSDLPPRSGGCSGRYFNPRSPHGERPCIVVISRIGIPISTHAPRTGSDMRKLPEFLHLCNNFNPRSPHGERHQNPFMANCCDYKFQPTLPARGATVCVSCIAINKRYFNPRSPHGERRGVCDLLVAHAVFQPTLPARGATRAHQLTPRNHFISTHAPRTGSDAAATRRNQFSR